MLIISWGLFLLGSSDFEESQENKSETSFGASVSQISPDLFPVRKWSVNEPEIIAQSAIVVSFGPNSEKESVLYYKSIDKILPIASLTKIMTTIIALENFNPEEIIKISKTSVDISGDNGGLIRGEELKVKDLLYIMLMESSNDAAMALANDNPRLPYEEFINLMNSKARELGLNITRFQDPIGLSPDNQSTALEIVNLTKYALNFPLLSEILRTPEATIYSIDNQFIHNLTNTNKLLGKIPQIIGGKTGFTDEAGGCMLTVSTVSGSSDDNYLITVVLASTQREDDTEKLINWTKEAWIFSP